MNLMKSRLRILHLEDNKYDSDLVQAILSAEAIDCDVVRVETRSDFLAAVEQGGFDIFLTDYTLPSFDGVSALAIVQEKCPEVPFIFVTGTLGEEIAIETLKSGATDYVFKERLSRLAPTLRRALGEAEERSERKRILAELEQARPRELQMRDEFLSHISHELRSPLFAIYQFTTILLDGLAGELNPEQLKYLEIALKNVNQLQIMIEDLLEISRIQVGKLSVEPKPISLTNIIDETLSSFHEIAAAKGITLSADFPSELP